MKIPFGKYKGLELDEVPIDYLNWLSDQRLELELKNAVNKELQLRKNPTQGVTTKLPDVEFMNHLAALLEQMPDKFFGKEMFLKTITGNNYIFKVEKKDG